MCFSPEVSFGSAVALVAVGAYCWHTARRQCPRLWPVALVPGLFGLQQATEGLVWLGLNTGNSQLSQAAARIYLFFALAFWPICFSVAAALIEPPGWRRKWLFAGAGLSTVWFWVVYLPIALDPNGLSVRISHHSIRYDNAWTDNGWSNPVTRWVVRLGYGVTVAVPLALTSAKRVVFVPAAVALSSALVAALLYDHAYTSVWCLYAAVLSVGLAWGISRTKEQGNPIRVTS